MQGRRPRPRCQTSVTIVSLVDSNPIERKLVGVVILTMFTPIRHAYQRQWVFRPIGRFRSSITTVIGPLVVNLFYISIAIGRTIGTKGWERKFLISFSSCGYWCEILIGRITFVADMAVSWYICVWIIKMYCGMWLSVGQTSITLKRANDSGMILFLYSTRTIMGG